MPDWLTRLVASGGYPAVFLGVLLESAGVPVPGETVLLAAAFFAHQGHLALPAVVATAATAAILGDNLGYWIGRRAGRPLVERVGPRLGLTPDRLASLDGFFARHGPRAVFLARFVAGFRVFAAPVAGVTRVPWRRFLAYNAAGGVTWALAVGLTGYLFGGAWHAVGRWTGRTGLFVLAFALALFALTLVAARGRVRPLLALVRARLPATLAAREAALVATSLGGVALFAKIAEDVVERESTGFDHAVSLAMRQAASPALDAVMAALTLLGSAPVVLGVAIGVAGTALLRGDRRAALAVAAVGASEEVLNALLKFAFHRARPSLWAVATLHSYSFPSGHAMAAVAVYGMTAVVLARLEPRLARAVRVLTPALTLGIGLSRVYLGVHWPTDVLAGFAAGAVLLAAGACLLGGRAAPGRATDEGEIRT